MKEKPEVLPGTLALMVLKTFGGLGAQHGKQLHAIITRFFEVRAEEDLP